ncbi:bifunctional phosphopantothenoylcysteine decarboxylase/phosphopantothenate--cysteine ligase CoaBC [Lipingzhangella sp. LS1_29]|uniref:Coenzyme A biosynthesis bifunctional protein CoaBC n=1 Tax=Lipingzhangella rawalii TaxID=2055835 RepID=A0ABU2H392_9ACTN|nr:bifunctional phosphopantothenoylcysteine decarboxylase/phosphopantothenate--cysteine ligase CoaBC [Lipingzhangella rawalii]MDS1269462.1 bifunctional phosphopantothenoylcysteine decarboxylase/phosphopantothenate--cysteine ligase CoaBC [Lipingzhangella rawalii]
MTTEPAPRRVVLGVGAGIAAYKVCDLLRRLTEAGHEVRVVPTADALRFVGAPTWSALSGNPVASDVWSDVHEVPHVRLGQTADLLLIAPATADLLAKAAHGIADDLLTNTLLTARCPVIVAPAMHTEMWEHSATQSNVATLRARGVTVLDPDVGRLTGADTGRGRLPEPEVLFDLARGVLRRGSAAPDLGRRHVLVTAGGTREAVDPVRYLGNRSSGRQGYALAATAAARGARVTLVAANSELPDPAGVEVHHVESALEMRDAVWAVLGAVDAVAMAAAVADFRPSSQTSSKIKKTVGAPEAIPLTANPDILAELTRERNDAGRTHPVIIGFAAETDNAVENGRAKLASKGCDLLVVNEVGAGRAFGTTDNQAVILGRDGSERPVSRGPKEELADEVWDLVIPRLSDTQSN